MRKRRMLQNQFSLAALAVCGVLLAGCGGDGNNSPNNLDDPNPNASPVCTVVAAFVDLASQEIVIDVAIFDGDQTRPEADMTAILELITNTGTFGNDVVSSSSGNLIIGNRVSGLLWSTSVPGFVTRFRISSTSPNLLPSDPTASVRVTVNDAHGGTTTCTAGVDLSLLLSEPDCQILAPGAADFGTGIIPIDLQVSDNQGDTAQISVFYSLDGGATLSPATLTATTAGAIGPVTNCNPANPGGTGVIGIPTNLGGAPVAFTVSWDSLADGVALVSSQVVTLVIFSQDCTTNAIGGVFNAPCTQDTNVLNNGAPICTITAPLAGSSVGGTGTVNIDYTVADMDSAIVSCGFEWSTNGGTTWNLATAAAPSTNPQSGAPGAGTFGWDVPSDIAVGLLPADVNIRKTADDLTGRPVLSECFSGVFTLVPISEPSCAVTAPGAGVCADVFPTGILSLVVNLIDSQGDPINYSVCYSIGAGNLPATLTGVSSGALGAYVPANLAACVGASNQVIGAAAGSNTIMWDVMADGLGGMSCTNVTVTIFPEDGTTAGVGPYFTCTQAFSVSNNGAPSCVVNTVSSTSIGFTTTDADSALLTVTVEFSVNGGATFAVATPSAGTNPLTVAPGAGMFPWMSSTDIPTCTMGVIIRLTVTDGVALPNRPATCSSVPTDVNCIPVASACRAVDALGTASTGPTGVNPAGTVANGGAGNPPASGNIADTANTATNYWNFDYTGENTGPFNTTRQMTDAGGNNVGNPVLLGSAGHDYTAVMDGGVCNAVATFDPVLEANIDGVLTDISNNMNPFMGATITTTWLSSDAGNVTVSADGLLTAVAENSCSTISWAVMSSNPAVVTIDPTCAGGSFVCCVESGGWDTVSRGMFLPMGDYDTTIPGMPTGMPVPGVGSNVGATYVVNTGTDVVAACQSRTNYMEAVIADAVTVDVDSIGGSTRNQIGDPFATNPTMPGETVWNDVNTVAANPFGIFDMASQTFTVMGSGTSSLTFQNEELANPMACNIWVQNPCMPFNSFVCPTPPPPGGYQTIAGSGFVVVP